MPTLYVRDFPKELHDKLRATAAKRHRSLGAEAIALIEQALEQEAVRERRSESLKNMAKRRRSQSASPGSADSLDLLREDRGR